MHSIDRDFARRLPEGDPFQQLQAMEGKVYREVKGRKTLQFKLGTRSYFVKNHAGVGWAEILKNLLQLRLPILGAQNEWRAIRKLESLGLTTMTVVAYGSRGWNPASRQSFIVTEDLSDTISLEDFCRQWRDSPPKLSLKRALLDKIAGYSRTLHGGGVCHRDYYLCHFLMPREASSDDSTQAPELYIIDLHRALIKESLPRRWIIKDLGGLLYSAMDIGLTRRDYYRFIKLYDATSLRDALTKNAPFWNAVHKRATTMRNKLGPVE